MSRPIYVILPAALVTAVLPHLPQAAPQGCREYRLCGLAGVCACGHLGGEVPLFVGGRELPVEGLGGEGGGRALLP